MSLWCLLAAPLLAGNDLTKMTPETITLLTNPEVVAVDQGPARHAGISRQPGGALEVWMKPFADCSRAVGLFNRGESPAEVRVHFRDIEMGDSAQVRDLWARQDLGTYQVEYDTQVPSHGAVLIRVK